MTIGTHAATAARHASGPATREHITTGVTGGAWRASITEWGAVEPWGVGAPLDWHIAADDRWHSPQHEAAVRQRRIEGTAVVETRVRIPDGDAVQRIYSVPDHGGLTIIEVENASPLAIAVAFTRGGLLSVRPPSAPIEGISLPPGSVAFPVGHHATLTVAVPHRDNGPGALPGGLPTAAGVVRGWSTTVERAGRLLLPDAALAERVVAARCELALVGPEDPAADPVGFLLAIGQLVRMGERPEPWVIDVAQALESAARSAPRDWALAAAIDAADHVLAVAGETRARRDLVAFRAAMQPVRELPARAPAEHARLVAWVELLLVTAQTGAAQLLPRGLPAGWEGDNFEVYGVPTGATSSLSFAIRWHGARPAVLWEQTVAEGPLALSSPAIAPEWCSSELKGEALWPQPAGVTIPQPAPAATPEAPTGSAPPTPPGEPAGEGGSFS